ncbi:MAG: arylesterase [Deltaproteobacteria bacterium]|nr:arylesterase [Deltaproteobacteria bacterium]MBI2534168.1 arylesterase [Deltaproteobacteria bacterium]MBI3065583.1 arylesterase [Deltaproteobacteria bacterium]
MKQGRASLSFPLLLIVPFLLSCGGEGYDRIRNLRSAGQTIICFGDSLTEGVGASQGEDYPSVLSRLIAAPVVNAGHRGDTTADALNRLARDVLEKNPRLVILLLGGNDFLRQVPAGDTRKNLETIVQRIQERGAMVVITGMKLGLFTDEYGAMMENIAEKFGALLVPQVTKGILTDSKLKSDPIHPNGAGYRLIAERVAEKVKPLLARADRERGARAGA